MSPWILLYRLLRNWEIHSWNFSIFNLNGSWGHLPSNIFHTPSTIVLAPLNLLQLISNHLHLRMSQLLFQQQSVLKYRSNMAFMCLCKVSALCSQGCSHNSCGCRIALSTSFSCHDSQFLLTVPGFFSANEQKPDLLHQNLIVYVLSC